MGSFHSIKAAAQKSSDQPDCSRIQSTSRFGYVVPRDMESRKKQRPLEQVLATDPTRNTITRAISGDRNVFIGLPILEPEEHRILSSGEMEARRLALERQDRIAYEREKRKNGQGMHEKNPVPGAFGKERE
jgi:hypothetical protein